MLFNNLTYGIQDRLIADYPLIPKAHIHSTLLSCAKLYTPTYLALRQQQDAPSPPYVPNKRPAKAKGKYRELRDSELEKEFEWLECYLVQERAKEDAQYAKDMNNEQCEENGDGIECGCCFSSYPFVRPSGTSNTYTLAHDCGIFLRTKWFSVLKRICFAPIVLRNMRQRSSASTTHVLSVWTSLGVNSPSPSPNCVDSLLPRSVAATLLCSYVEIFFG